MFGALLLETLWVGAVLPDVLVLAVPALAVLPFGVTALGALAVGVLVPGPPAADDFTDLTSKLVTAPTATFRPSPGVLDPATAFLPVAGIDGVCSLRRKQY